MSIHDYRIGKRIYPNTLLNGTLLAGNTGTAGANRRRVGLIITGRQSAGLPFSLTIALIDSNVSTPAFATVSNDNPNSELWLTQHGTAIQSEIRVTANGNNVDVTVTELVAMADLDRYIEERAGDRQSPI